MEKRRGLLQAQDLLGEEDEYAASDRYSDMMVRESLAEDMSAIKTFCTVANRIHDFRNTPHFLIIKFKAVVGV